MQFFIAKQKQTWYNCFTWTINSVVECFLDVEEVMGSNPLLSISDRWVSEISLEPVFLYNRTPPAMPGGLKLIDMKKSFKRKSPLVIIEAGSQAAKLK